MGGMKMNSTVVMATYNGERYLEEQLNSIFKQTLSPNEVLIFDDKSSDRTPEIVRDFISSHNTTDTWKLEVNETNKGHVKNFLDGATKATGDVIFFSDQDDVWDDRKIELMMNGFETLTDMQACYCLRRFIDCDGSRIPMRFEFTSNPKRLNTGFQKISLNEAIKYNKSPGLCLGIRKELILETKQFIIENNLTHDLPIGTVAAIYHGYYVLNQKLVNYRVHNNNVSTPRVTVRNRLMSVDKQVLGRRERVKQMRAILDRYGFILSERDYGNLENAIEETELSIENMIKRNHIGLTRAIFSKNPMMNRWIALNNLLVSFSRN
jgi:glycosyltransferase involved in cell wall biosynthesis